MFSLLSPVFFYVGGAIGVLVPLVLHLIQSRRTVRVPFPTTRFLKLAQEKASRRVKMENIILWILRTLLLVTLALAFAMPMLRSKTVGRWFGRSPRDVAVVLDGSYSMAYNLGRSTVWEKAIDCAVSIVEGLQEQDRVCVFVARERVEPIFEQLTGDREQVINRLKTLTFSQTASQLAPAVMDANTALKDAEGGRRERELHLITDSQALPWNSFGEADEAAAKPADTPPPDEGPKAESTGGEKRDVAAMGVWDPTQIDRRTVCFVSLLGVDAPENMAPVDVKVEPSLIMAGDASKAVVRLGYTGPAKGTTTKLLVDDEEVANRSVVLDANQGSELVFAVPPLQAGKHVARVETPEDNLELDNAFHVILTVEDQFPSLCVGTRDDTLFIRAALMAGRSGEGGIQADWVEPGSLNTEKLGAYACVFLCNALPMAANEIEALEKFVSAGGLLVLFPGDRGAIVDYPAWSCLPGVPAALEQLPTGRRKQILSWDAPHHPLLDTLDIGGSTLSVSVKRYLAWDKLAERAERLISHGGERAFLVGRPYDQGYVLMFAVSADRSWSDFPLSPFYLPIIHQIVQFGAGVGSHPQYVWCTDSLPLNKCLPDATRSTALLSPEGKRLPVRSAVVDTRTVLHVEDLTEAGIYKMFPEDGGDPVPALAVNMDRKESNLTPIDAADVHGLLRIKNVNIARDLEELLMQIKDSRVGRTFGEMLLWLVLLLAALEFFYANYLLKRPCPLSALLGLSASGRPTTGGGGEGGNA